MLRHVIWEWVEEPGLEYLTIAEGADAIHADGIVVSGLGGTVWRLNYRLLCTPAWEFRSIAVDMEHGAERRTLNLARGETGAWTLDGIARPDLAGCTDIDIEASPFTNTLPIRRLSFAPGETKRIGVAYIRLPSLEVLAADQEYTRLDSAAPPRRFRYLSVASGFTSELTVDEYGVVEDYPGIWKRLL